MIVPALVAAVGLYVVAVGGLAARTVRVRRATATAPPLADDALPPLAVVVPARDEEANLPRCLDALLAQDYPADRLTLVVADDHSTDGTAAVARRYQHALAPALVDADAVGAEDAPVRPALHLVHVEGGGPLRGKAAALDAGIAATDAPLVLLTDADCAPPPGWCRAMAAWLSAPDVGLVCGRTEVETHDAAGHPRALAAAQALDWTYLLTGAAALTESGRPSTAMGNNMGLRRAAYDAVGGYRGVPFSVTEDHALFHALVRRTPWRVRFPLDPALAVRTRPLDRLGEVYGQRRRWARGGLTASAALWALYTVTHLGHLAPLLVLGLAAAGAVPVTLAAGLLGAKLGVDTAFLRAALPPDRRRLLRALPAAEGLLFLYFTTLPAALLLVPRVRWKGRVH